MALLNLNDAHPSSSNILPALDVGDTDATQTEQITTVSSQLCGKSLLCEDPIPMRSTLLEDALVFCRRFLGSFWGHGPGFFRGN